MKKCILALMCVLALGLGLMTGCSGGEDKDKTNATLRVVLAAPYVMEEQTQALEKLLNDALPQLTTAEADSASRASPWATPRRIPTVPWRVWRRSPRRWPARKSRC